MTSWKAALTRPFKQCRLNIFGHVCVLAENVNPCMAERLSLCSVTPLRWTHNSVASPYCWQPLLVHLSLNLCLRLVEWDKTLANAKTYPAEDTLASKIPFSVHVWRYLTIVSHRWLTDRVNVLDHNMQSYVELKIGVGGKTLAWLTQSQ